MKTISKLEQTYAPIILDDALVRQTTEQVGYVSHRSGTKSRNVSLGTLADNVRRQATFLEKVENKTQTTKTQCNHYSACPQRRCNGSGFWYETKGDSKIKVECRSYE